MDARTYRNLSAQDHTAPKCVHGLRAFRVPPREDGDEPLCTAPTTAPILLDRRARTRQMRLMHGVSTLRWLPLPPWQFPRRPFRARYNLALEVLRAVAKALGRRFPQEAETTPYEIAWYKRGVANLPESGGRFVASHESGPLSSKFGLYDVSAQQSVLRACGSRAGDIRRSRMRSAVCQGAAHGPAPAF